MPANVLMHHALETQVLQYLMLGETHEFMTQNSWAIFAEVHYSTTSIRDK